MGIMGMAGFVDLNEYTYVYGKVMFSYVDELPSKKLPRGFYLVHNHAKPQRPLGRLGKHDFRVWVQTEKDDLIPCTGDWRAKRGLNTMSPRRDRKSETTTR